MTFAKSVEIEAVLANPRVVTTVKSALAEPPPREGFAPMTWPASERDEIKRRLASFKAHQLRMQNEREDYYLKTMTRTRALIDNSQPLEAELRPQRGGN
jgi:hypothetical protein